MQASREQGRARAVVEGMVFALIKAAAGRRQGEGRGEGARAAVGLAQPRRRLTALREPGAGGGRPITAVGWETAVRDVPPVLAKLAPDDPRRRAAAMLADAIERAGAIKGGDWAGGDHSGGLSDGGVTTRIKHSARLRLIEALANGWPIDARHGRVQRLRPRVVLSLGRPHPKRREIRAWRLLVLVCVEGLDMRQILALHGWSGQSRDRRALTVATLDALADVAYGLGLGRAPREAGGLTRRIMPA